MASRRMFSIGIIDSDVFLDMPTSSQNFYFHLAMRADDDGFINNPRKIQRIIGASDDDVKILITKNYIYTFESGIIVVKHWRQHNYLRKDRYKISIHTNELNMLNVLENGEYTLDNSIGTPLVNHRLPQTSKDKSIKGNSTQGNSSNIERIKKETFKEFKQNITSLNKTLSFSLPYPFEKFIENTKIKLKENGYLHNLSIGKDLDLEQAFTVWNYMYEKREKIYALMEEE